MLNKLLVGIHHQLPKVLTKRYSFNFNLHLCDNLPVRMIMC